MTKQRVLITWKTIFWMTLLGLIGGTFAVFLQGMAFSAGWVLSLTAVLFTGLALGLLLIVPYLFHGGDWFHPFLVIFLSLFVGTFLRSLYFIFFAPDAMLGFSIIQAQTYLRKALFLTGFGILFLIIGYTIPLGRAIAKRIPAFDFEINRRRTGWLILLVGGFGILGFVLFLDSLGSVRIDWPYLSIPRKGGNNFYRVISRFTYLSAFLALMSTICFQRFRSLSLIFYSAAVLMTILTNTRSDLLGLIIVGGALIHYLRARISGRDLILILFGLVLLSTLMLGFREVRQTGEFQLTNVLSLQYLVKRTLASRDFADVTTFAHIIRWVNNQQELLFGETYFRTAVNFIPRGLWPDKPRSFGTYAFDIFYQDVLGESKTGVPTSILGELYWNFHLPGLLVGMLVFGIIIRIIYEFLIRNRGNPLVVLWYGWTLYYLFEQTRVYFSIAFTRYLYLLIPLILVSVLTAQVPAGKLQTGKQHAVTS
jgi:oligosaccharide repeat unit polymerase